MLSSGGSMRAAYVCSGRTFAAQCSIRRQEDAEPEQGCDKPEPKEWCTTTEHADCETHFTWRA